MTASLGTIRILNGSKHVEMSLRQQLLATTICLGVEAPYTVSSNGINSKRCLFRPAYTHLLPAPNGNNTAAAAIHPIFVGIIATWSDLPVELTRWHGKTRDQIEINRPGVLTSTLRQE